jgi:GntP family gluconate:H+ symporter
VRSGTLAPFGTTLFIILLPILLMMAASAAEIVGGESITIKVVRMAGAPSLALLIGILAMLTVPSLRPEGSLAPVPGIVRNCIKSVGPTILTVAAGGGFAKVLTTRGLAKILGDLAASANLSIFVYGWLAAAFVRVVTGSATVSITVAAELLVPQLQNSPNTVPELLIVAIGCGSLFFSHLNDAGFWIVKDSLKISIRDMLRTWTITETLVGISGLGFTILVSKIRDLILA